MTRGQLFRIEKLERWQNVSHGTQSAIHTLEVRGDRGSGEELLAAFRRAGSRWLEVNCEQTDNAGAGAPVGGQEAGSLDG